MDTTSSTSTKETVGGSSDTASTSYQPFPEMTAEQEFFLYELEATDSGSIGLVLRAIYDCGDVTKFSRALEHRIHQYDKNIQKVCSFHYQGYVDSMKQLLQLKEKCAAIKEDATQIDNSIQEASAVIAEKTKEIMRYRNLAQNCMIAIDQISVCLPVLENYSRLQELMAQKKYYQALKIIEELEHTHLELIAKYRFTKVLSASMEPLRAEIKDKAYSEFKDFLEIIKKVARRIGQHASKCTAELHSFGISEAEKTKRLQEEAKKNAVDVQVVVSSDGSLVNKPTAPPRTKKRMGSDADDEQLSAQDLIDFTPIHRCSQIFNVLGAKDEFESYYREQRKEQCEMVIQPPPAAKMRNLRTFVDYLDEIIGFFVVEDHVMLTEPSLVTPDHKDALWKKATDSAVSALNSTFGQFSEIDMMLRMKKVVILFALTMKNYGFNISPLYRLLDQFTDQYTEILMTEYVAQFVRDLEVDNYTSVTVENEEQFKAVIRQFPFYKRSMETEPYPRKFHFSQFVVAVYTQAKSYLVNCLKFMENLQISHTEMEDRVRKFANLLLVRWSERLKQFVTKKRTLVQLVQITVNIGYLERSCEALGPFITKITSGGESTSSATGHLVVLSEKVFRDARSEVEQQIDASMQGKVNEFIELAQYDWELPASSGHASDYISDLLNFLSSTFLSFTNLPNPLARHVIMQICKYLADRMTDLLLSPDTRAISTGALEQFSLDVMQCEMFTARCPVQGFDHQTLPVTFATLRQLLDLVMTADWTTYLAEYRNETKKYNRVMASVAVVVLEKMVEFERRSTGFFSVNRGDRKKLLDTILKQLRALAGER